MKANLALTEIKRLCFALDQDRNWALENNAVGQLNAYLKEVYYADLVECHQMFLSTVYCLCCLIKSAKDNQRILIVNTITQILQKFQFKKNEEVEFKCICVCLIKEICNPQENNSVLGISEEYKLCIIKCLINLMNATSCEIIPKIYQQKNIPWLTSIIHICTKVAKDERLRSLRIAALECIMAVAKINEDDDLTITKSSVLIADIFMLFFPGIVGTLMTICSEEEKRGHNVIKTSLRAWGRVVAGFLQNRDDSPDDLHDVLEVTEDEKCSSVPEKKFKTEHDISEYVKSRRVRNMQYPLHDKKLEMCMAVLNKLTISEHPNIRRELVVVCDMLTFYCMSTLPKTASRSIEILITLSEDEYEDVANKSKVLLYGLSDKLSQDTIKMIRIRENLEHNFYLTITKLPRIFNGLDQREQLISLNLVIGYLGLFSRHRLKQLLFTYENLNRLIKSLLNVTSLKNTDVGLLEEYSPQELEMNADMRTPWKVYNFHNKNIQKKLEACCHLLAQPSVSEIVLDFLMDTFENDVDNRKEATVIMNEVLSVCADIKGNTNRIKHTITMYLEPQYWDLLVVVDNANSKCTVGEVQNNITQLCLQLEGIGKMALALNSQFQDLLLKVLYVVLEKAGSSHPLLRAAGLTAVRNISVSCGYKNVTELINKNSDYFSHHVMLKLKRPHPDVGVFNVLAVVLKHSNIDVLPSISEIVDGVLLQSCDKYQAENVDSHLRVFKFFIKSLYKWLDINLEIPPMRTKEEREKEIEDFKISNLEKANDDFSDEAVMGKSAEQMWQEDTMKTKTEIEEEMQPEVEEYNKPEPPTHIKLTVSVLKRCLNFLPSKDATHKILTLEILKDGLEILADWEEELLPVVHLIWSPLIDRFKEFSTPLIINLSFQLLATLARLSKDFIRHRTIKDVIPQICTALSKQSKESYLKDKGYAYRYTQGYKMQLTILPELGRLIYDLDVDEKDLQIVAEAVQPYLSNKQPIPLQEGAVKFYKTILLYNRSTGNRLIGDLDRNMAQYKAKNNADYNKNYLLINDISEHR